MRPSTAQITKQDRRKPHLDRISGCDNTKSREYFLYLSTLLFGEVVEVSLNGTKYGMHFQIMSANAIDANAGAKLLKKYGFSTVYGLHEAKKHEI